MSTPASCGRMPLVASVLAGTGERHGSVALGSLQLDPLEGLLLRL